MNRINRIVELIKNQRVIDIGGIDHDARYIDSNNWLHGKIAASAEYVLGVDLLEEEVKIAQKRGYNFIQGDAEHLMDYVDQKFNVCVAGELIEHLANPGLFLRSVHDVLEDDGLLILTTPNAFSFGNIYRIIRYVFRLSPLKDNLEHKAWYDMFTLGQALKAQGFEILEMRTVRPDRESNFLNRLKYKLYGNANSKIFCVAKKGN